MMLTRQVPKSRARQSGAVLIVALVLLVALTLLGISTMNTSQLEEKMAANNQEITHAFQAAETALSQAFNNGAAWQGAFGAGFEQLRAQFAGSADGAEYAVDFIGWSPPPTGSLYSSTTFQAGHFNFRSTGSTTDPTIADPALAAKVRATVNGGAYQIAPKQ
jgi:hypothetical protein